MMRTISHTFGVDFECRPKAERANCEVRWDPQRNIREGLERFFRLFPAHYFVCEEVEG